MAEILYKQLSCLTVGATSEVHRILGPGFLEAVYEQALAYELAIRQIPFERQIPLLVTYKKIHAATGLRLAILFNFGTKSLQVKRIIR